MMKKLKKTFIFVLFVCSISIQASDVSIYKNECSNLGFKIGTKANSNCALKLLKRAREIEYQQHSNEVARERLEQERIDLEYQQELIREQQRQAYELQQRAVAAQEQAAAAQERQANSYQFNNALQMLMGTGAYSRPQPAAPRAPISCLTMPNGMTSCQ